MFTTARKMMVDSQLRPNKVMDDRLIAAFSALPREAFLPASLSARAYADENIRLGQGRVMLAPMALARLLQESNIGTKERVLVVGAGTGYGAAVVAATGADVTALESDSDLLSIARPALAFYAPRVVVAQGSLVAGWSANAPYDLILIEGAVAELPKALEAQLADQGRIMMVQDRGPRIGVAVIGVKTSSGVSFISKFDCVASVLPGFAKEAAFTF
jgi:protein-L-isoaspartate(D-aspartate) O-methyltransferase